MAELAIRLPIFIASPSDVASEREIVYNEILEQRERAAAYKVILEPFLWEHHARPSYRRPQAFLNKYLRTSELTVALFWSRLGSVASLDGMETGTQEEFRIAGEQVYKGRSDDVFLYFRRSQPPSETNNSESDNVKEFRQRLIDSSSILFWDYDSPKSLQVLFRRHLEQWVRRWEGIADICQYTLENSPSNDYPTNYFGESRLQLVRQNLDLELHPDVRDELGSVAVELYQQSGPTGSLQPFHLSKNVTPEEKKHFISEGTINEMGHGVPLELFEQQPGSSRPLVSRNGREMRFANEEWFYFFCAWGLTRSVEKGDLSSVERIPYVNEIHQYFRVLVLHRGVRSKIVSRLLEWLTNRDDVTLLRPIARNFAAYELGMLEALESQDALAEAAETDRGEGVKLYSIMALGKMRSRRHLPFLKQQFFHASNEADEKLSIGQAICRITGITSFEL